MPSFHAFFRELFQTFLGDFIRIAEPDFIAHLLPEQAAERGTSKPFRWQVPRRRTAQGTGAP